MEVRADDIPAALGIERTETDIDYAPVRIGDSTISCSRRQPKYS